MHGERVQKVAFPAFMRNILGLVITIIDTSSRNSIKFNDKSYLDFVKTWTKIIAGQSKVGLEIFFNGGVEKLGIYSLKCGELIFYVY